MTLERFTRITAGFTHLTVRVAMVRAIIDLRGDTPERPSLREAGYHHFYRAVLGWLP